MFDWHPGRTQFDYRPKTTYPDYIVIVFTPIPLWQMTGYYFKIGYYHFIPIIRCILLHNHSVISHFDADKFRVDSAP